MSEFEEQLKQEELAKVQSEGREDHQTEYTDADGTVYEWDAEKKAWFPKINADFIAQYQMSYGVNQTAESGNKTEGCSNEGQADSQPEYSKEEYDKYWRDYYNYYYYHQNEAGTKTEDPSSTPDPVRDSGNEIKATEAGTSESHREQTVEDEDRNSDYYHYFSQYYDENYTPASTENASKDKGEGDSDSNVSKTGPSKKETGKAGDKRKTADTGWVDIDDEKNTNVYVSGLPLDVTDDEFKELMTKCGLIMTDLVTGEPKLKLYRDEQGEPKGDARCCYIKVESVKLALQILDGSDLRGHKLHVERAKFTMKGNFDPKKRRKKLSAKEKKKLLSQQQKLLDWKPEINDTRMRWEKVVVLKHMFEPQEFEDDPTLINDLREDVREECSKHGEVKKVILYDRHPEGVMTVHFKEFESADLCVQALNGRWFAKKRISAETWDGKTKYEIEESNAEREERLKKWSNFLEDKDIKTETTTTTNTNTEPPVSRTTEPLTLGTNVSAGASSSPRDVQPESSASGLSSRDSTTDRTSEESVSVSSAAAAESQ